jgi:hypothetical protein
LADEELSGHARTAANCACSWQDGLAFCALVHLNHPELIDFNTLNKSDPRTNLQLAFDTIEKSFGIPPMLDVDDMLSEKIDDKAVMTYVSLILFDLLPELKTITVQSLTRPLTHSLTHSLSESHFSVRGDGRCSSR